MDWRTVLACLLLSLSSLAHGTAIRIAVDNIPPYVILESQSGMELEIVREAFATQGVDVVFQYSPIKRTIRLLKQRQIDGAISLHHAIDEIDIYYSSSYLTFQNVFISLKKNNIELTSLSALQHKKLAAFNLASTYLGPEYKQALSAVSYYEEVGDPPTLVPMLYNQRVELIAMELALFRFIRRNSGFANADVDYAVHPILSATPIRAGFISPTHLAIFEAGLKQLGPKRIKEILQQYQ